MANDKADETNDETLVDTEELNQKNQDTTKEAEVDKETEAEESDEVVVSINGATPDTEEDAADAPVWVKNLRQQNKDNAKRLRELEAENKQLKTSTVSKAEEVGAKPTLESSDYDADKFEQELLAWNERKRKAQVEVDAKAKADEEVQKAWEARQRDYETAKGNLKVKDFTDTEDFVKTSFSIVQQGIIVKGAKDAAVVVYALGKNPETAKKLAAIKDPIEFAFAVARLEGTLKVTAKTAPNPEKKPASSGGSSNVGAGNKELERLRAEAEKSGNYTKVVAYKNSLKNKSG